MKVILTRDVRDLGRKDDVKEVSDGYARNFLFPKKLAIPAGSGALKSREHTQNLLEDKKNKAREKIEDLKKSLIGKTITIKTKVGESGHLFAGISASDISKALEENGFSVDASWLELSRPLKTIGKHPIAFRAHGVSGEISLEIVSA